jgi:ABC-type branched-subunit amino acid transport system substrate-binding protein
MGATPGIDSPEGYVLNTEEGRQLLALFGSLTTVRSWRLSGRPFPVVVLDAAEPQADVGAYVDALEQAASDARIPHISPVLGTDAEDAELTLLATMSEPGAWRSARPEFGPLRFPRSDLVKSLERAIERARENDTSPTDEWNAAAALSSSTRRPNKAPVWWSTIGVIAAALLGGFAQGLADKVPLAVLLVGAGVLLAVLLLVAVLLARRLWLPILTRLGFGTRYRWFATSSFFAVLGGDGFEGRLKRVFDRMTAKRDADKFRLQLKSFAFLEDLRAAHRRLSPNLRGFKRPVPPVVFLNGITKQNGGIELLSAMSDIRSRRSELHPLLVIASVDHAHRHELDELAAPQQETDISIDDRYRDWEASLGIAQAPSQQVALPWVLRLPIPPRRPGRNPPGALPVRRRPRWTWLWSRRSFVAALLVTAIGIPYFHVRLTSEYCHVGFPFSANTDSRLRTDADGSRECVGVATNGVRFDRGSSSIGVDGNRAQPHENANLALSHGSFTLADLQSRIERENQTVLRLHQPYVTVLYAGILSAAEGHDGSVVSGIRSLAGAYLAQLGNNHTGEPGAVGNPLKIRLLPVNVGENMYFSRQVADQILALARRDPTIVGVVGMERNTDVSQAAITRLNDAGLAIVDTVNSSDRLPTLSHYYGLASTDHDEAALAAYAARKALNGHPAKHAMIVSRAPGVTKDDYSAELAADAEQQLRSVQTSTVRYSRADDIGGQVRTACAAATDDPFDLIYFAGRAEDLYNLINNLGGGGCAKRPLTLLGGDEVARAQFGNGQHDVVLPPGINVYFTSATYPKNLIAHGRDRFNFFFTLARNNLGIASTNQTLLADGQMALTYDATSVLAQAAQEAFTVLDLTKHNSSLSPGSRAVTSGSVLLELPSLKWAQAATGTVDFTKDDHDLNGPGNRGLTLVSVKVDRNGAAKYQPVCGRMNGGGKVADLPPCP